MFRLLGKWKLKSRICFSFYSLTTNKAHFFNRSHHGDDFLVCRPTVGTSISMNIFTFYVNYPQRLWNEQVSCQAERIEILNSQKRNKVNSEKKWTNRPTIKLRLTSETMRTREHNTKTLGDTNNTRQWLNFYLFYWFNYKLRQVGRASP